MYVKSSSLEPDALWPSTNGLLYITLQGCTSIWAHGAFLIIDMRLCVIIMVLSTWTQLRDPSESRATCHHLLNIRSRTIINLQMNILLTSAERINAIQLQVKKISKDLPPLVPLHTKSCLLDWTAEIPLEVQKICDAVHLDLHVILEYFLNMVADMEDRDSDHPLLNVPQDNEVMDEEAVRTIALEQRYDERLRRMQGSWKCISIVSPWLQNIQITGSTCTDGGWAWRSSCSIGILTSYLRAACL